MFAPKPGPVVVLTTPIAPCIIALIPPPNRFGVTYASMSQSPINYEAPPIFSTSGRIFRILRPLFLDAPLRSLPYVFGDPHFADALFTPGNLSRLRRISARLYP